MNNRPMVNSSGNVKCPTKETTMVGRKKQFFGKMKSLRMNPSDLDRLEALAKLYQVDESEVIRAAIKEKYERDIEQPPKNDTTKA